MNKSVIICFVKTPGLTPAKTRLAHDIGPKATEEIYLLLIERCKELLRELKSIQMDVFFAVNEVEGLRSPIWENFSIYLQQGKSLGEKLKNAEDFFLEKYDSVFFIGSDSPSLSLNHIETAKIKLSEWSQIFIPAKDGGFVLYGSNSCLPSDVWLNTTYSSSSTLSQILSKLDNYLLMDQLTDLDSIIDIIPLLEEMNHLPPQGKNWEKIKIAFKNISAYLATKTAI